MDRKEIPKKTRDEDYLREAIQAAQATWMKGTVLACRDKPGAASL